MSDKQCAHRPSALVRGRYWYDFELEKDEKRQFTATKPDGRDKRLRR